MVIISSDLLSLGSSGNVVIAMHFHHMSAKGPMETFRQLDNVACGINRFGVKTNTQDTVYWEPSLVINREGVDTLECLVVSQYIVTSGACCSGIYTTSIIIVDASECTSDSPDVMKLMIIDGILHNL